MSPQPGCYSHVNKVGGDEEGNLSNSISGQKFGVFYSGSVASRDVCSNGIREEKCASGAGISCPWANLKEPICGLLLAGPCIRHHNQARPALGSF